MPILASLMCGLIFGAGLLISGMVQPTKVLAFLDIFGAWDPTLTFVMGGAIVPMAIAWRFAAGRRQMPIRMLHRQACRQKALQQTKLCRAAVAPGPPALGECRFAL